MMELTKEGKETLQVLDLLTDKAPELGFKLLKEVGADAEKETKIRTPQRSRSMISTVRKEINKFMKSVTIKVGGITAKYGNPRKFVDYAVYVEEGTIRQQGQHFLFRGVNAALNKKNSVARMAFTSWLGQFKRK